MANQRDPDKRMLGSYVSSEMHANFSALAESLGISAAELLRMIIDDNLNQQTPTYTSIKAAKDAQKNPNKRK